MRELCELILAAQGALDAAARGLRRLSRRAWPDARGPQRTCIDRLDRWSPVLLLGGLAALTYWLDAQVQPPAARDDGSARHDPDMYIENFRAVSFDADGRVLQMLAAARAEHFPDDDSVELVGAVARADRSRQARAGGHRRPGTVSGDRENVSCAGNVRADARRRRRPPRATAAAAGPATFTTEFLRVIPKLGRAETDRPVTIEEPRGIIHGVGMVLDNKAHTIKLKSAVRGTLQPNPLPK